MNRLRLELGDFCEMLDASLGAWEIRRNGMRVMKLEVTCGDSGMGKFNAKRTIEVLKLKEEANIATLEITPWQALSATDRQAVEEEGRRLLAFLAPDATSREVRLSKRED